MPRTVGTVPPSRTTLIGRDDAVRGITSLLDRQALVTLTGPGGSGKTRLATEVAHSSGLRFPDGAWFVDLASTTTAADVAAALLTGMSVTAVVGGDPMDHAADAVRGRRALVVVDNCEHVLAAAAAAVDSLILASEGVRVLATSREALGSEGERVWAVAPLETSSRDSSAIELFCERALAVDPNLTLDEPTLDAIVEVTRRVDGMPLAIELAAARCRALSPQQILRHLEDGIRLLSVGVSADRVQARQQSLEAAIAWSYGLLEPEEQRWFRWLSACAGRFSLNTAARILEMDEVEAAGVIDALVSRSLLVVDDLGAGLRIYRFLETIRSYGRACLDGDGDAATAALERALRPPPQHVDDVRWLSTHYTAITGDRIAEGRTRRAAARHALEAGRLDSAAFIAASSWAPESAATLELVHGLLCEVLGRGGELSFPARFAALASKATVEAVIFRYFDCMETCREGLDLVGDDHPGRGAFEAWLTILSAGLDPVGILGSIDQTIASQVTHVRHEHDFALGWLNMCKANIQANLGRLDDARGSARESLRWLSPTVSEQAMTLATLLWLNYLTGRDRSSSLEASARRYAASDVGFEMCAKVALAVTDPLPVWERGAELVRIARRRPLGRWHHEESELLAAFGHLALEEGRLDDARRIAEATYFRNPSTIIALVQLLAHLEAWTSESWTEKLAEASQRRFSPPADAPEPARVLAAELEYWDARAGGGENHMTPSKVGTVLGVLGPVELVIDGHPVEVPARQQRAILSAIAAQHPMANSANRLVEAVWGDDPPLSARRALQAQISRIRSGLGCAALSGDSAAGYRLDTPSDAVDVYQFCSLLDQAAGTPPAEQIGLLRRALGLWRGQPLEDLADTAPARAVVAGLWARHDEAEEDLAAALLGIGDARGAVEVLEQLVESEPLRERRWALLIDALRAAGRRGEALRAFQRGRSFLIELLGIEPGEEMRRAEARVLG